MKLYFDKPTITYLRPHYWPAPFFKVGNSTFIFRLQIDNDDRTIVTVGWAFCSKKDRFNKQTGRALAFERLASLQTGFALPDHWKILNHHSVNVDKYELLARAFSAIDIARDEQGRSRLPSRERNLVWPTVNRLAPFDI